MKIAFDSNVSAFSDLEAQGRSKLADAAQQFEAMLMQEMLKPMRSTDGEWGEEKTDGASDTITSFGTEAVARSISKGGGLGIARQVIAKVATEKQEMSKKNVSGTKV